MLDSEPDLDPQHWNETRALAYQMLNDLLNMLADARSNSAWRMIPDDKIESLREPVPQKGVES